MQRAASAKASPEQARLDLALWLRHARAQRGMSVEDVSRITKIQPRILECLESGQFERLPADVFVRGFVRSVARCVGLDADEALARLMAIPGGARSGSPSPSLPLPAQARALVETMSELAPTVASSVQARVVVAEPVIEIAVVAEGSEAVAAETSEKPEPSESSEPTAIDDAVTASAPKKRRTRRAKDTDAPPTGEQDASSAVPRRRKKQVSGGTAVVGEGAVAVKSRRRKKQVVAAEAAAEAATETVTEPVAVTEPVTVTETVAAAETATVAAAETATDPAPAIDLWAPQDQSIPTETISEPVPAAVAAPVEPAWSPRMPAATPSVPWRRAIAPNAAPAPVAAAPVLSIDDSDPERAARELDERSPRPTRRSFLPPILLDRNDRSARQGGLTLAVIILLIAATLTLSYLMRRPSSSGDGVTLATPTPAEVIA